MMSKKMHLQMLAASYGAGQVKQGQIAGAYPPPEPTVHFPDESIALIVSRFSEKIHLGQLLDYAYIEKSQRPWWEEALLKEGYVQDAADKDVFIKEAPAAPKTVDHKLITWSGVEQALDDLMPKLPLLDEIICVSRGGLVPGALLAHRLGIKHVSCVAVTSYEREARGGVKLLSPIRIPEGRALVIDDLVDSGATFDFLKKKFVSCHITFACLFAKPKGMFSTDIYGQECSQEEWLSFPWERSPISESVRSLQVTAYGG